VIVNVCPAAVARVSPERVWSVLTAFDRFGEWNDVTYLSSNPPGAVQPGQAIHLTARGFGRSWPVTIEVREVDPQHRWIDLRVRLPLGVDNHEHITLTETPEKGTLVRFN
jgi:uncharacterized protein YndB with AHSA1/START domain